MIKKKRNLFIKLGILCTAFVGLITAFVVPTKAYYVDNNGNFVSSNLFDYNKISDDYRYASHAVAFSTNSQTGVITFDVQASQVNDPYAYFYDVVQLSSGTYTWSFTSTVVLEKIGFVPNNTTQFDISYILDSSSGSNTFTLNETTTLGFGFEFISAVSTNITIMLNSGSTALSYETYGEVWYSQSNYNNYGSEQYNNGVNDVYNSLQQQPIAQSSNVGGATLNYDMSFYNNITFTDSNRQAVYIELTWAAVGGKYSSIAFSFDSDYYVTNVTLSSFNPPFVGGKLVIQGYEMDIDYVNGTWGFYNISSIYNGSTRSIVIQLSASSSTPVTIRFKINSLLSSIADTQTAYNTGYENGYHTAEDSYIEQVAQLENANATLQSQLNLGSTNANALFWTIASTPFESFKTIWNVDVLGLNISGFVLGVLLALIILYIIKKVW